MLDYEEPYILKQAAAELRFGLNHLLRYIFVSFAA